MPATVKNPRIDPHIDTLEEGLSRWVGDVAAHQVGRVLRGVAGWGEHAGETVAANVKEYLQEETRDLVPRPELEGFAADVTALEQAVSLLEERVTRLKEPDAR
jgi:ubiquinone biosynthesis protein UbiJ